MSEILSKLQETIDYVKTRSEIKPRIGITLGSGLSDFVEKVQVDTSIPYAEIPNFAPSTVEGHPGKLVIGHINEVPVAILQGRIHFYEGHKMEHVVYPTRVLAQLGIQNLILTNAAGGLNPQMKPGDFMIIKDHINLTGSNPLVGPNIKELGLRFPDMSEPYDIELSNILSSVLKEQNVPYFEGIYCGVSGPTYETAAEVKFLQTIGGQAVGMSTVPETIAAKHMGLRVCGISCITNLATGISPGKVTHDEVTETGRMVKESFSKFLYSFVEKL